MASYVPISVASIEPRPIQRPSLPGTAPPVPVPKCTVSTTSTGGKRISIGNADATVASTAGTVSSVSETPRPRDEVKFEHEEWADDEEDKTAGKDFDEVLKSGTQAEKSGLVEIMCEDVQKFLNQATKSVECGMYGAAHEFMERAGDVLIMANEIVASMKPGKPQYRLEAGKEKEKDKSDNEQPLPSD